MVCRAFGKFGEPIRAFENAAPFFERHPSGVFPLPQLAIRALSREADNVAEIFLRDSEPGLPGGRRVLDLGKAKERFRKPRSTFPEAQILDLPSRAAQPSANDLKGF